MGERAGVAHEAAQVVVVVDGPVGLEREQALEVGEAAAVEELLAEQRVRHRLARAVARYLVGLEEERDGRRRRRREADAGGVRDELLRHRLPVAQRTARRHAHEPRQLRLEQRAVLVDHQIDGQQSQLQRALAAIFDQRACKEARRLVGVHAVQRAVIDVGNVNRSAFVARRRRRRRHLRRLRRERQTYTTKRQSDRC